MKQWCALYVLLYFLEDYYLYIVIVFCSLSSYEHVFIWGGASISLESSLELNNDVYWILYLYVSTWIIYWYRFTTGDYPLNVYTPDCLWMERSTILLLKNIDIGEYGIWTEFRADISILIGGNAWKNSERSWIP